MAESVIGGILREVAVACATREPPASAALIGHVVKAVLMDPSGGYAAERTLSAADVSAIVSRCVARLSDPADLGVATLALQCAFQQQYTTLGKRRAQGTDCCGRRRTKLFFS